MNKLDFYHKEWKTAEKEQNEGYALLCKEIYRELTMESMKKPYNYINDKLKMFPIIYLNQMSTTGNYQKPYKAFLRKLTNILNAKELKHNQLMELRHISLSNIKMIDAKLKSMQESVKTNTKD